ncbi:hypothetical protein SDC9_153984 [bioreactor metagenome]|uniref:Uncharacterized protein n=1 Tax=bioreactor metagenome TaxID=1076179 RepID=A0A645EXF7_9ZZZZ
MRVLGLKPLEWVTVQKPEGCCREYGLSGRAEMLTELFKYISSHLGRKQSAAVMQNERRLCNYPCHAFRFGDKSGLGYAADVRLGDFLCSLFLLVPLRSHFVEIIVVADF